MSAWADTIARGWAAWYTRRVAHDVADRRRAEIESDLFEHATARGHQQFEVLGRVLWGIPADLSWRRAARASHPRRSETGASMNLNRVTLAVVIALVALLVYAGIGTFSTGGLKYPALFAVAVGVVGVVALRERAPRTSAALLIVGAASPMAIFYWMAPLFAPLFVVVTVLILLSQLRRSRHNATT